MWAQNEMDHMETQSRRATRRQSAHRPADGQGEGCVMAAYEGRRCLKSCPTYHQATSCSCGQPGDSAYRQKRPNEDLDASEDVYMETQSRVVGLRADNLRLRIAHLRRMSDACLLISMQASSKLPRFPTEGQWKRFFAKHNRWSKFRATCRAEITRLTQPR